MAFLSSTSCGSEVRQAATWPQLELAVAFLVDATDASLTDPSAAFGLSTEGVTFGAPEVERALEEGESLYLIGWAPDDLLELEPVVAHAQLPEAELVLEAEQCANGRVENSITGRRIRHPLSRTTILRLEGDTFREVSESGEPSWVGSASIDLPRDPESCGGGAREMVPFGARADLLLGEEIFGRTWDPGIAPARQNALELSSIARVDIDRVVAASAKHVYLFERGQPFVDDDFHRRSVSIDVPNIAGIGDLAVDASTTRPTVLVATGGTPTSQSSPGLIVRYEVGSDGLVFVETATTVSRRINALAISPNGSVMGAGHDAIVVTATSVAGPFSVQMFGLGEIVTVDAFSEDGSFVLGSRDGAIILATQRGSAWDFRELTDFRSRPVSFAGRQTPRGTELWAATRSRGVLVAPPGGDFAAASIEIPPSAAQCTARADECGHFSAFSSAGLSELVVSQSDGVVVIAPETCPALFAHYPAQRCSAVWSAAISPLPMMIGDFTTVSASDGFVTVGGVGTVHELEVAAPE